MTIKLNTSYFCHTQAFPYTDFNYILKTFFFFAVF